MYPHKLRKIIADSSYFYRTILAIFVFIFAYNLFSVALSKNGFAFADEESATGTIESIISTSTINDLTSSDSISTTSVIDDSIGDTFSEITAPVSGDGNGAESTTTDNAPVLPGDSSTSTDPTSTSSDSVSAASSSDATSTAVTASSTSAQDLQSSTSTENSFDETQATSSDSDNSASTSTATSTVSDESNSTSTENADVSSSTEASDATSTEISTTTVPVEDNQNDSVSTSSEADSETQNMKDTKQDVSNIGATVTSVISPILSGTFKSGRIPVIVSFNRPVYVSGKPELMLVTGDSQTSAVSYLSGSGSRFIIFLYYIKQGDSASPLDYQNSSSLELNGGTIKDSSGNNDANLTLPEPGSSTSLSGSTNITIRTSDKN